MKEFVTYEDFVNYIYICGFEYVMYIYSLYYILFHILCICAIFRAYLFKCLVVSIVAKLAFF